jgi:hypothetical protein
MLLLSNTLAKLKGAKGETMIYNTLHREPKIEQYEPHNYFPLCSTIHDWKPDIVINKLTILQ